MSEKDDKKEEQFILFKDSSDGEVEQASPAIFVPIRPRRRNNEESGKSAWLVTFTDAMALMLAFFVMMFAMSEPEPEYWTDMATALHSKLESFEVSLLKSGPVNSINLGRVSYRKALNVNYLEEIIKDTFEPSEILSKALITKTKQAVILSFPTGTLLPDSKEEFRILADFFGKIKNQVIIYGHSDPIPVKNKGEYVSNWGVSLDRANKVAMLLKEHGYKKNINISGFGDSQFNLIPKSMGQQARYALSRRVDILILGNSGTMIDPF